MIRLECTTGGSNKFYEFHREEAGSRITIKALYGKIGQAPQSTVIYDGDDFIKARDVMQKKAHEKRAKGYRDVAQGDAAAGWTGPNMRTEQPRHTPYANVPIAADVPIIWAMNAQGVKDDAHFDRLMGDNDYIAQEKLDGMRALVHVTENGLRIFSRSASVADPTRPLEKTASLPHLANLRFERLAGSVFDCEILAEGVDCANISGSVHTKDGGRSAKDVKIYVFDMLMDCGKDLMRFTLEERLEHLGQACTTFRGVNIVHVPYVISNHHKMKLFDEVMARGGEGIMLKNLYATYQQGGRPSKNWYKKKKEATFDVVIMGYTKGEGKYNLEIGAVKFGQYINGVLTEIGQTSGFTDELREKFTKNPEHFKGTVITVKGMERLKSGAIRHPRFVGFSSKRAENCVWYDGEQ